MNEPNLTLMRSKFRLFTTVTFHWYSIQYSEVLCLFQNTAHKLRIVSDNLHQSPAIKIIVKSLFLWKVCQNVSKQPTDLLNLFIAVA